MKKIICAILAAVLMLSIFVSCVGKKPGGESGSSEPSSAAVTGPDTSDIERGEILGGKFYLGMTRAQLVKALADENMKLYVDEDEEESYTSDGGYKHENGQLSYMTDSFSFMIDNNGTLLSIMVSDPGYQSAAGLKFGDSFESAKAIYGEGKAYKFVPGWEDPGDSYALFYSYKFGDNYLIFYVDNNHENKVESWQISKDESWIHTVIASFN